MFNGTLQIKICEASGLRPTDFQKRHTMSFGGTKSDEQLIDPYVSIDVDDLHLDRSSTKTKIFDPIWNESFCHPVHGADFLNITDYVFSKYGTDRSVVDKFCLKHFKYWKSLAKQKVPEIIQNKS